MRRHRYSRTANTAKRQLSVEPLERRVLLTVTPFAADSMLELASGDPGVGIDRVAAEHNGNLVAFGLFRGTVDVDPGPGVTNLTTSGEDLFVARYDSAGALIAAVDLSDGNVYRSEFTVDESGAVYFAGKYSTPITLLGGISLPAPAQSTESGFVAKLDSTLQTIQWYQVGTSNRFSVDYVSVDGPGDYVYVSGSGLGFGDFGGEGFNTGNSINGYVSRINATTGQLDWLKFINNSGTLSVTVDPVDPSAIYAKEHIGSPWESDAFRLDTSGNIVWKKTIDDNIFWSATPVASDGGLYLAGRFSQEVVLDGFTLVPDGIDALLMRLDGSTGKVTWAVQTGGPAIDSPESIAVDNDGNLFMAGSFEGTANFGPDTLVAATDYDRFLSQFDATNGSFVQSWRYGRAIVNDITTSNGNTYVSGAHDPASIDFPSGDMSQFTSGSFNHVMRFVPGADPTVPRINGFRSATNEVEQGQTLSLDVVGMHDPDDRVDSVSFFHDVDSNRLLDLAVDQLLGTDNDPSDGWNVDLPATVLPTGLQSVVAQGTYDGSATTLTVSDEVHVINPTTTYVSTNVGQAIRDLRTVNSTLNVADSFIVSDVNVTLDITHTHNGDLDVFLVHPDGTQIELFTDINRGAGLSNVTIDGHAEYDFFQLYVDEGLLSGRYRPESNGALELLNGKDSQGVWTLEVTDDERRDTGTLVGWSVTLSPESIPASSFSIDDGQITEGDSGTTTIDFAVTRSGDTSQQVSVDYTTADDTATAGIDYVSIPTTTLTFAPGVTSLPVSVTVNGDVDEEPDETFFVNLTNPVGGTVTDAQGVGTILDDDSPIVTSALFVYDIRFDSKRGGKDHRAVFEIRADSDGNGQGTSSDDPIAGVEITVTFAGTTYTGTTDSNGVFRTPWVRNTPSGDHYANAVDLALAGYVWDLLLDLEDDSDGDGNPDDTLTI